MRLDGIERVGAVFVLFAFNVTWAGDTCEPQWLDLFGGGNGLSSDAYCLEVYDDGAGPAVYVGGGFFFAGGERVDRIAKWNGTGWELLSGPSGNGVLSGNVTAMCVYDDGTGPALFVGGDFPIAGGLVVNKIAKWDGVQWSPLTGASGTGFPAGSISALEVFDDGSGPKLYVAGNFTAAGGVSASDIATWDGSEWAPILSDEGNGVLGSVNALKVHDDGTGPGLFVGGLFNLADNTIAGSIAKWNGEAWSLLEGSSGVGVNVRVHALEVYDEGDGPVLFVGGQFSEAGGISVKDLARWDGMEWSSVIAPGGEGVIGVQGVLGFTRFDDGTGEKLVVSGDFPFAGGVEVNSVGAWDGTDWSAFQDSMGTGIGLRVYDVQSFETNAGPALFAVGDWIFAGGISSERIAQWQACDPVTDPCEEADVTGNNAVDLNDLNLVLSNFGQTTSIGDTNSDGVVNLVDINAVLGSFGQICP